ncbi:MAG TPA: hypothetical protein VHG91_07125, partial [Longimicrobium sp.]|nr:hypothetical protein [Longimicrobium sp.]
TPAAEEAPAAEEDASPVAEAEVEAPSPVAEAPAAPAAPAAAPSGEELAAWISEVETESGDASAAPPAPEPARPAAEERPSLPATPTGPQRPSAEDIDGWDPFGGEFGGPAPTQPGDAEDDLPWLTSIDKAAGTGAGSGKPTPPATPAPSTTTDGELDFLNAIENASVAEPEADLGDDDLAFLEELDRAISGGTGAKGATPPAAAGDITQEAPAPSQQPKGAVLCRECGAINEPQAWYCEICGSEL